MKTNVNLQKISDLDKVISMLNKNQIIAIQIAPGVRVAIGEEFGFDIGQNVVGKLVTALKKAGFKYVYDVCAGADFTIIEESKELVHRIKTGKNLPLFTSCCPIWVKYLEMVKPDYKNNLSTCKSPTEMLSTLIKYFSPNIKVVSVTPCVGKKIERERDNNIDVSLTTRECAQLIKLKNIDFYNLKEGQFDDLFGVSSGAGNIFGVTGGVMEAVLRTTVHLLNNDKTSILEVKNNNSIKDYEIPLKTIRTNDDIREITIPTNKCDLKIAIVNGIASAKRLFEEIEKGKIYHFVEFQNCKGGCIMGPGQPYVDKNKYTLDKVVKLRGTGLYDIDKTTKIKTSHSNQNILGIYGQIGEKQMQEMLHLKNE